MNAAQVAKVISQAFVAASMVGVNMSLSKIAHNTSKTPTAHVFFHDDDDDDDDDDGDDDDDDDDIEDGVKSSTDIK